MLRQVDLPSYPGQIFLGAMPGRYTPLSADIACIQAHAIDTVFALASMDETRLKAPDYAACIERNQLPCERRELPIPDFGVPEDRQAFLAFVKDAAAQVTAGKTVMLHCGAGIGRTGTMAVSLLIALGVPWSQALNLVEQAGSHPETPDQHALVAWVAESL